MENDDFGLHNSTVFKKIEKVGSGTYGDVYRGIYKLPNKNPEEIAIKKMKIDLENEGIPSTTLREITILRELDHPNIIKLKDVILEQNQLFLLFDFMDFDLKKYLEDLNDKELDEETIKYLIFQIIYGVAYCHSKKIIHRDLKPQNILLDKEGNNLKIADFGLARAFSIPIRPYTKEVLTLWYRAPELLLGVHEYSTQVDIWSIGCIFAELFLKRPLFKGDVEIEQIYKIFGVLGTPNDSVWPDFSSLPYYSAKFPKFKAADLSKIIPKLSNSGLHLLKLMLEFDPNKRISAKQALQHPYFNSLKIEN